MRLTSLFLIFFLAGYSMHGQIYISTDQTWASDTVFVVENTIVDHSVNLTVAPGTVVLFGPSINLSINGTLKAEGTANSPIIFSGIDSVAWGGIKIEDRSYNSQFKHCKFFFSHQQEGGAIHVAGQDVTISNCEFLFNTAEKGGALFFKDLCRALVVEYCLIANNNAQKGGGIYLEQGASLKIFKQNTVTANRAEDTGGYFSPGSNTRFFNNIVWGNDQGDLKILQQEPNTILMFLEYSLIGGSITNPNVGLINPDPLFKDPSQNDFSLSAMSPAIDHGCHCILDADGTRSDMGYKAFVQIQPHLDYIMIDSLSGRNTTLDKQSDPYIVCTNLKIRSNDFLTIGAGAQLIFAERSYIDVYGKLTINGTTTDSVLLTALDTSSFYMPALSGREVYGWGGLNVYQSGEVQSNYTIFEKLGFTTQIAESLIIGALTSKSIGAVAFDHCKFELQPRPGNAYRTHPIIAENSNIKILNSEFRNSNGIGTLISLNRSDLTIENTVFENNKVSALVSSQASQFNIRRNRFTNNSTRLLLGLHGFNSSHWVEGNIFEHNLGVIGIENVSLYDNYIYFRNNIYTDNRGQILFSLGRPIIAGNIISRNTFDDVDYLLNSPYGIVRFEHATPYIINNTITDNYAGGAGALCIGGEVSVVVNNVLFNNNPSNVFHLVDPAYLNSSGRIYQNNLQNELMPGKGNREGNPRLQLEPPGFALMANSPAIDNGNLIFDPSYLLATDISNNPRIKNTIDIGALEFTGDYVPLTDILISDTTIERASIDNFVATFTTTAYFDKAQLTYRLIDENGLNNDYFLLEGNQLHLTGTITNETLLRIKIRVMHTSGAWLEEYFYLSIEESLVTGVGEAQNAFGSIYPNPVRTVLHLKDFPEGSSYTLLSANGSLVDSGLIGKNGHLQLDSIRNGIYFIRIASQGNVFWKKIIKLSH